MYIISIAYNQLGDCNMSALVRAINEHTDFIFDDYNSQDSSLSIKDVNKGPIMIIVHLTSVNILYMI